MISGIPLLGLGQGTLLAVVFLLVLTDKLVWHRRLRVLEKRIEEQDKHLDDLLKQNGLLLDSAIPTVNAVLNALHSAAGDQET